MARSHSTMPRWATSNALKCAVILTAVLAGSVAADSAELGDAKRGGEYAKKVCSECHGVSASDEQSPDFMAPTFREVANTKGITERALYVWLQSGNHESMPNFIIDPRDLDDVIAYIMSMRATQAPQ